MKCEAPLENSIAPLKLIEESNIVAIFPRKGLTVVDVDCITYGDVLLFREGITIPPRKQELNRLSDKRSLPNKMNLPIKVYDISMYSI